RGRNGDRRVTRRQSGLCAHPDRRGRCRHLDRDCRRPDRYRRLAAVLPTAAQIEKQYGQHVGIPQPAAGAGFSYTDSVSEYWMLRSLCFQILTDANAANRIVFMDLIDPANVKLGRFSTGFNQTATTTTVYTFGTDIGAYGANGAASLGSPVAKLWLHPGSKLTVGITNVQAGDQVSAINLAVDQVYGGSYAAG